MKKTVIKRLTKSHDALENILNDLTEICESLADDDCDAVGEVITGVEQAINAIREIEATAKP